MNNEMGASVGPTIRDQEDAEDYHFLAEHMLQKLNPRDDDIALVAILCASVDRVVEFVEAQPCACLPDVEDTWESCRRCWALRRRADKPLDPS